MYNKNNSLYPILQNESRLEIVNTFNLDISPSGFHEINECDNVPLLDLRFNGGRLIKGEVNYIKILRKLKKKYINSKLELISLPIGASNDGRNFTIGKKYKILDIEGSNFWTIDDFGDKTSIGSSRFKK